MGSVRQLHASVTVSGLGILVTSLPLRPLFPNLLVLTGVLGCACLRSRRAPWLRLCRCGLHVARARDVCARSETRTVARDYLALACLPREKCSTQPRGVYCEFISKPPSQSFTEMLCCTDAGSCFLPSSLHRTIAAQGEVQHLVASARRAGFATARSKALS